LIEGGSHAGNGLPCQSLGISPVGASCFREALVMGCEIYHTLKGIIKNKYGQDSCNVGDEGGFAPVMRDTAEALDVIMEAVKKSGYESKVKLVTDVDAKEFYKEGVYDLDYKSPEKARPEMKKTSDELIAYHKDLMEKYPFLSIEDPFDQDDWNAYSKFVCDTPRQKKIMVVGDSLLATNRSRIETAISTNACNAMILQISAAGTLTEALEAAKLASDSGWDIIVSHRSGETEDCFISDLAVGLRAYGIKTGAPCRSERLAKYNQLLRIEEEVGSLGVYAGAKLRSE